MQEGRDNAEYYHEFSSQVETEMYTHEKSFVRLLLHCEIWQSVFTKK